MSTTTLNNNLLENKVKKITPRYRTEIGKYIVRRTSNCIECGKCIEVCPYGVHGKSEGSILFKYPKDYLCIGEKCQLTDHYCIDKCPANALRLEVNPIYEHLGDYRWTADLILSCWYQAETGNVPENILEYKTGNSGGGFDKLRFKFPDTPPKTVSKGSNFNKNSFEQA